MRVYLVRHGEAADGGDDDKRPLTKKGRADTTAVGRQLVRSGVSVPRIFSSPKVRARQTAEILSSLLNAPVEIAEGLMPGDDPDIWAKRAEHDTNDIMLVGHLPHLGALVSQLVTGDENRDIVIFKKAAVVAVKRTDDGWRIQWMVTPKIVAGAD